MLARNPQSIIGNTEDYGSDFSGDNSPRGSIVESTMQPQFRKTNKKLTAKQLKNREKNAQKQMKKQNKKIQKFKSLEEMIEEVMKQVPNTSWKKFSEEKPSHVASDFSKLENYKKREYPNATYCGQMVNGLKNGYGTIFCIEIGSE